MMYQETKEQTKAFLLRFELSSFYNCEKQDCYEK